MSAASKYVNRSSCPGCNATPQKCQRKWHAKFGDDPVVALDFFNSRRQHTNSHPNKYKAKKYLEPLAELPSADALICLQCFNEWEKLHKNSSTAELQTVSTRKRRLSLSSSDIVSTASPHIPKLRKHSLPNTEEANKTPTYRKVSIRHDKCIFGCPSTGKGSLTSVSKSLSFNLFTKYKLFAPASVCKVCKSHQTTVDCDLLSSLVGQVQGRPMQMSSDALTVFDMLSGFVAPNDGGTGVEPVNKKNGNKSSTATTIDLSAVFQFTKAQYKQLIGFTSEQFKRLVLYIKGKPNGKQK